MHCKIIVAACCRSQSTKAVILQAILPADDGQSAGWSQEAQAAENSHQTWNQARRTELQALIDKANAASVSYKQTDQNNTMRP